MSCRDINEHIDQLPESLGTALKLYIAGYKYKDSYMERCRYRNSEKSDLLR